MHNIKQLSYTGEGKHIMAAQIQFDSVHRQVNEPTSTQENFWKQPFSWMMNYHNAIYKNDITFVKQPI